MMLNFITNEYVTLVRVTTSGGQRIESTDEFLLTRDRSHGCLESLNQDRVERQQVTMVMSSALLVVDDRRLASC